MAHVRMELDLNFIFLFFQKHACPYCGERLRLSSSRHTYKAGTPEAEERRKSVLGKTYGGNVTERLLHFRCPNCGLAARTNDIKSYEQAVRRRKKKLGRGAPPLTQEESCALFRASIGRVGLDPVGAVIFLVLCGVFVYFVFF